MFKIAAKKITKMLIFIQILFFYSTMRTFKLQKRLILLKGEVYALFKCLFFLFCSNFYTFYK